MTQTQQKQPNEPAQMPVGGNLVLIPVEDWNNVRHQINEIETAIKEIKAGACEEKYLTISEVCEVLRIGRNTFYKYRDLGAIPTIVIGKKTFVKKSELQKVLETWKKKITPVNV